MAAMSNCSRRDLPPKPYALDRHYSMTLKVLPLTPCIRLVVPSLLHCSNIPPPLLNLLPTINDPISVNDPCHMLLSCSRLSQCLVTQIRRRHLLLPIPLHCTFALGCHDVILLLA